MKHTEHTRAAWIVGTTVVVVFIFLGLGTYVSQWFDEPIRLPFLVISGLMSLLGVLAAMAIAFKAVHLANQTQALGLPDGTIRAVIALSLILIFAAVTVFLFSALSDTDSVECKEVQKLREDFDKLQKNTEPKPVAPSPSGGAKTAALFGDAGGGVVLAALQVPPGGSALPGKTNPPPAENSTQQSGNNPPPSGNNPPAGNNPPPKPLAETVAVTPPTGAVLSEDGRKTSKANAAQDFAKQLLIMLGTLITSITSFYFGSKTATDVPGGRPAPSAPRVTKFDPSELSAAQLSEVAVDVRGTGSGLLLADAVTLKNADGAHVGADNVTSSETSVGFKVPKGTTKGKWDVIVKTRDGGEATSPGALTIT